MFTLLELIQRNPFDRVAVVIPEQNLRVTYGQLYAQVRAVAEQFFDSRIVLNRLLRAIGA